MCFPRRTEATSLARRPSGLPVASTTNQARDACADAGVAENERPGTRRTPADGDTGPDEEVVLSLDWDIGGAGKLRGGLGRVKDGVGAPVDGEIDDAAGQNLARNPA